ncbi:MAG: glycosyl transferase, group 1 family protein [Ilumatobacteraceae bacterium]|nr:glycosyl transferase, group 1 family protein [Ilumatobacteraceae bacterium]
MRKRVVHYTDALDGGVATAIATYARLTPGYHHSAIVSGERSKLVTSQLETEMRVTVVDGTYWDAATEIRRASRPYKDSVLHTHSSIAGVLGRVIAPMSLRTVYTPHCYAFERKDISVASRAFYLAVESCLGITPRRILACSQREYALAKRLPHWRSPILLGNTLQLDQFHLEPSESASSRRVVACGRLVPQKRPLLFAALAERATAEGLDVEWVWIGDGDQDSRRQLERSGVTVTGWLGRSDVLRELNQSTVYAHVAAWEGMPYTVLEAMWLDMRIVAMDIPALRGLEGVVLANSDSEMYSMVKAALLEQHSPHLGNTARLPMYCQPAYVAESLQMAYQ